MRIDGRTEGSIHYSGTVAVGPHGALIGDVHATAVVVEGALTGSVYAANSLHLAATATMIGDMYSPRIAVARGAQVRGNIMMRRGLAPPADLDELAVDTLLRDGGQA